MPHAPSRAIAGLAELGLVALGIGLCLACSPPDGRGLFTPLLAGGSGGVAAGSAGAGAGAAGSSGAAGEAAGGAGAGGSAGGAGAGGVPGGSGGPGAGAGPDASVAQASDAGLDADSGAAPAGCSAGVETCNGLDDDCDGVADAPGTCAEECRGVALGGRGYMFCAEALERGEALERCASVQMNLTWLETPEETAALVQAIAGLGAAGEDDELLVQIGASDGDDEETWRWVANAVSPEGFQFWEGDAADDGGEPVAGAYQAWAPGEPNDDNDGEDCAVLSVSGSDNRDPGQWDDRSCDSGTPFVCEAP
jgi:hypothetical protein